MAENFSIDLNGKAFLISEEEKSSVPEIKKAEKEDKYFIQLRDCFNTGYQMPQYCIDNKIKKPLFVGVDESQKNLLWEIHTQFTLDGRVTSVDFCLTNGKTAPMNFSAEANWGALTLKNISEVNVSDFDKVIILTDDRNFVSKNVVYLDQLAAGFIVQTYRRIPVLSFMQKNPKVILITLTYPVLHETPYNTEHEKFLLEKKALAIPNSVTQLIGRISRAQKMNKTIPTPYDHLGYSNQEVLAYLTINRKTNFDGSPSLMDNEIAGVKNGKRLTANQPAEYKNSIYFVGNCVWYGYGVPYDKTVESHLQRLLNEHGLSYRVENESQPTRTRRQDMWNVLNNLHVKPGDIVFLPPVGVGAPRINSSNLLDGPHKYGEVFPDSNHINENGHRAWADKIFEYLTENNFFQDVEFNYPPPQLLLIVMVSRKNLFQPRQIFCKIRNLKNIKINFAKKECQSAA